MEESQKSQGLVGEAEKSPQDALPCGNPTRPCAFLIPLFPKASSCSGPSSSPTPPLEARPLQAAQQPDPRPDSLTCNFMLPKLIVLVGLLQGLDGGMINFSQPLQDGCKREAGRRKSQPSPLL